MGALKNEQRVPERQRLARELISFHRMSSQQVKTIAMLLVNDDARLEFASAAYAITVDPENFYEVYDAFTTFSRVMRLHDRIHQQHPGGVMMALQPISEEKLQDILRAIQQESFEDGKKKMARQILMSSQRNFLSSQIAKIVNCFTFEAGKLDMAKFAFDYAMDRESYYQVNETLTFQASKDELAKYITGRMQPPKSPRPR
jgi:hypothetical protein